MKHAALALFALLLSACACAGGTSAPGPAITGCGADHERVGWTAELVGSAHDVGGTIEFLDDCTIELRDFTFDGTGLNVRFVTADNASFAGFDSLSEDLRRSEAYAGETLTFSLTEGMTLDDVDFVSIWCVPAGVSFGDAEVVGRAA
jgi:hypothetical protein